MATIPEVQEIEGERWSFLVKSRSRPTHKPWRVDLEAYTWNGACDCEDFHFSREPDLRRGAKASDDLRCHHILRARSYLFEEIFPKLAVAMGGPKMASPGAGYSPSTRVKHDLKAIQNVGDLIALRTMIDAQIEERLEHHGTDKQNRGNQREPQRPAPKIYHLKN